MNELTPPKRKMHANSLKNLEKTMRKPGQPPPKPGRKPGKTLKTLLKEYLEVDMPMVMPDGSTQNKPIIDSIIATLIRMARKGEMKAIKEVFDRFYGPVSQQVEVTGRDGNPFEIKHSAAIEGLLAGVTAETSDSDSEETP